MIQNEDKPENSVLPFLISPLTKSRGQIELCQNQNINLFEKKEKTRAQKNFRCKNQKTTS